MRRKEREKLQNEIRTNMMQAIRASGRDKQTCNYFVQGMTLTLEAVDASLQRKKETERLEDIYKRATNVLRRQNNHKFCTVRIKDCEEDE